MKSFFFSNFQHFRYERKFHINGLARKEVETILRFHPAMFSEIYCQRNINSIYFDQFNFQHYFDNINGVDRRLKVRVRWYGDQLGAIEKPTLEIKLKHNLHVGKLLYPLKSFKFDNDFSIDLMYKIFEVSFLNELLKTYLKELNFSLLVSYSRKYFLSADRQYRITVDTNMLLYKLMPRRNNFLYRYIDQNSVILEIKYNKLHDENIDNITNYFPFRMTKSSKYVDGITKVYI